MSIIYLSETAHPLMKEYLKNRGFQIHLVRATDRTYDPVSAHPDMYMCSLGPEGPVFFGNPAELGYSYPENIVFNAACTGRFLIHNFNYTSPSLLSAAGAMRRIHVSQGYAKCNIVIVDETSIITSDKGIFRACCKELDVLLIRPGFVRLRNFPYGFLGGACGRIGSCLVFNGNLGAHPDCKKITAFIKSRNLELIDFPQYDLEDIGSLVHQP